jgi:hypothetical protein
LRSSDGSLPDAAQRDVRQQAVAEEHGDERGDAGPRASLAVNGLRREQALEVSAVLHGDEQAVAVVGEGGVLCPDHEARHAVHVEAAGEEVCEHDDGDQRGRALGVHHECADGEAEAAGDEDVGQDDGERERERDGGRVERRHEVDDDGEGGGQGELHGQVPRGAGQEVGRERVHPRGALAGQHRALLREREHGVEGGEDAPEDGGEEEQAQAVLHRQRRRPPPHGARHQRRRHDLEHAQRRERLVPPLLEAAPEQHRELVAPARAAALRRLAAALHVRRRRLRGHDGGLHPRGQHLVVGRDERLLHAAAALLLCCDGIVVCLGETCSKINFEGKKNLLEAGPSITISHRVLPCHRASFGLMCWCTELMNE